MNTCSHDNGIVLSNELVNEIVVKLKGFVKLLQAPKKLSTRRRALISQYLIALYLELEGKSLETNRNEHERSENV